MCAAYGTRGHAIRERTVLTGYTCEMHSGYSNTPQESYKSKAKQTIKLDTQLTSENKPDGGAKKAHRGKPGRGKHRQSKQELNVPTTIEPLEKEIEDLDLELLDDTNTDSDCSVENSTWSATGSAATSAATAPAVEEASAELVSLMVAHPKLKDLFGPAIASHGPVKFREALCVVFKAYAAGLKARSTQPQEFKAGDLVRTNARRVAHACVAFHDPSVPIPDVAFRWGALRRQRIQAAAKVEDYLNSQGSDFLGYEDKDRGLTDFADESDREDVEDPLPNLSKVVAYMTSGAPFEQLQRDILNLSVKSVGDEGSLSNIEKEPKTEKLDGHIDATVDGFGGLPCEQVPNSESNLIWLFSFSKGWLRGLVTSERIPKVIPGHTRLSWNCDCGATLFEDYATTDPEKISKLVHLISRPTVTQSYIGPAEGPGLISISSSTISGRNTLSPQDDANQPNENTHLCSKFNTTCTLCKKRLPRKFLALCVNTGRFHKTLGEIETTNILRDNDTFRQIRSRYLELRSFRARARRLFLLRPSNVHFVKINVEDTFRADIIEKPSIPPHIEVHAKRYDYAPLDLPLPPITSNSFLHYMENPECESLARTSRWLSCLPKRLEEQLLSRRRSCEPDTIVSGWGIHIDETLNNETLAILALLILLLSAAVGISYTACTKDTSSGFAIAGYVATTLGVVISALYFRWQHE